MISPAILVHVRPAQLLARDFLAQADGFQHGAVAKPAAAHVVNLRHSRALKELIEGPNEVGAVEIVAYLFPLVAEDSVRCPRYRTLHKVGEEAMQLGPGVIGSCQATTTNAGRLHPEVPARFWHKHFGGHLGSAEEAVQEYGRYFGMKTACFRG